MGVVASLLPISSVFIGFEFLHFFTKRKLSRLELLSCSFPVGMCLTSLSGLLLNMLLFTSFIHFVFQVLLAFATAVLLHRKNKPVKARHESTRVLSLIGVVAWVLFWAFLSHKTVFPYKDKILRTGENDMMLEISLINSFYRGVNKRSSFLTRFQVPLHSKIRTFTAVIPPFYSALMKCGGCTTRLSILVPTILLFASISLQIFCFTRKLCSSEFAGWLSIPTVFLVGGFGYRNFLSVGDRLNEHADFVFYLGSGGVFSWAHPLLHCFLTSRLAMLSLSLALGVFLLLEHECVFVPGLLCILAFCVRPQSGFGIFLLFFAWDFRKALVRFRTFGIVFFFLAWTLPMFQFKGSPLWLAGNSANAFWPFFSMLVNVYSFIFISLFLCLRKECFHKAAIAIALFIFLGYLQLQPEHRFNFFTTQAVVTPLIVSLSIAGLFKFANEWKSPEIKGGLIAVAFFWVVASWLSSLCGLWNKIDQTVAVWGEDQNAVAKWVGRNTKRTSVFWAPAQQIWWNPAVARAGRVSLVGYQNTLQDFVVPNEELSQMVSDFGRTLTGRISVDYFLLPANHEWIGKVENSSLEVAFEVDMFTLLKWRE
jgi:hypothetical protein